jgi:hypothetical protein
VHEARAQLADEVGLAGLDEGALDRRQHPLHGTEDVLIGDEGARPRGSLAVQLVRQAHDRVGDGGADRASGRRGDVGRGALTRRGPLARRGQLIDVADLPGLLEIARLDRLVGLLRHADPLLGGVEDEDLEAARGLEHDLAVVRDDGAAREALHLADEGRGHDVLEAHPHLPHELAGSAVAQRHLGGGQDVLEDHEDVLVEDRGARARGSLAVEVAHDPHDGIRQRRLKLADAERLVVLGHAMSMPHPRTKHRRMRVLSAQAPNAPPRRDRPIGRRV